MRPVLKSLDQHLYVLSTLAFALMIQQLTAIEWSTEPQPFPRLFDIARGIFDQQFWLPMLACAATIVGLELLYRRTLDRARIPGDRRGQLCRPRARPARAAAAHGELRARRRDRRPGGFLLRRDDAGLLRQRAAAELLRLRSGRARRHGQQPRRRGRRPRARPLPAGRELPGRRHIRLGRRVRRVHHRPAGAARGPRRRSLARDAYDGTHGHAVCARRADVPHRQALEACAALPGAVLVGGALPLLGDGYWGVIATRACVYWVLVAGLNLVVGFAGQIAIGWVALLTLGAYITSVLAAGNVLPALSPYLALAIAGVVGAIFGVIVGLPALRLRTFYFAMTTLGFATIVTQIALAWKSVTGGGVGVPGPVFPGAVRQPWGFYYFCLGLAAICTWMTMNVAASRFGRSLVAIRDAEVAAEAIGISKPALLVTVFLFSGAVAGVAGGLFASLQSYITPDAFTFDLSVLFFIAILIGGRGSILGPLLGTIILTVLPEFAAPLVAWSTFLYAVLLLVDRAGDAGRHRRAARLQEPPAAREHREIVPRPELLARLLGADAERGR